MGRVLTNNVSIRAAVETVQGTIPTTGWFLTEPNSINTFGATITTEERTPISNLRQNRKGVVVDLDSSVEFETDFIMDHFIRFTEGFCFARYSDVDTFATTAATAGAYTVPSVTAATAARLKAGGTDGNSILFARGFAEDVNNGLKLLSAAVSASDTSLTVTEVDSSGTPIAETASTTREVRVDVAGIRGATGDIAIDADGNITSTVLDFTTLGLTVGQAIFLDGFTNAANSGLVLLTTIEANRLVLEKRGATFVAETGAGINVDLYFGRFVRNVPVDSASYAEITYTFEAEYPNLGNPSGDEYEYSRGNGCDSMAIAIPLAAKSTITFGFVGVDTDVPTAVRSAGAVDALIPSETTAFSTATDVLKTAGGDARLRIQQVDETGITTCFKDLTVTLANEVSAEKCIGDLGAKFLNNGNFAVNIEGQILFTDSAVPRAIRNNETLTFEIGLRNEDGGVHFNVPSMTLGGGGKEFPVNESVLINVTGTAFVDPILQSSIGLSLFPFLPTT